MFTTTSHHCRRNTSLYSGNDIFQSSLVQHCSSWPQVSPHEEHRTYLALDSTQVLSTAVVVGSAVRVAVGVSEAVGAAVGEAVAVADGVRVAVPVGVAVGVNVSQTVPLLSLSRFAS